MTCLNCGNEAQQQYCSHCGQRTNVKRITFKESWYDFWSRVYGFDGMLPRTLRDLTLRPGIAAKNFITGNRVLYYGPVGYFFLMITLFLIMANLLEIDLRDLYGERQVRMLQATNSGTGQEEFNRRILEFVTNNIRLMAFIVIPFNALASRYFVFRKSGLNFMEHMVLPLYLMGHLFWLNIIGLIIYKISGSLVINTLNTFAFCLFFGFGYAGLITYQAKWKAFSKGILTYFLGQLLMITFVVILTIIIITILAYVNPDALEILRPLKN